MKKPKILEKVRIGRYSAVYLALALVLLIVLVILVVAPKLQRHKGWIGIRVRQDPLRGTLVVTRVFAGSPAYDVGMLAGDRVLSYNALPVPDINTLKQMIHDSYVNQLVRIIIERKNVRLVADTRIAKRPEGVTVIPPIIPIIQGTPPPHRDRGLCIECHTIIPPSR